MTNLPHTALRAIALAVSVVSISTLLTAQALSAQPPAQPAVDQASLSQPAHDPPVQQVSNALGERLNHMMLDAKPPHSR